MKVTGNAKYVRRIHARYYRKNFDNVEVSKIRFKETEGRLTKGEWVGLVEIPGGQVLAYIYGSKDDPPTDGLDWNAVAADVKDGLKITFSTKGLVPWLSDKLGREPNVLEINDVIDKAKDDIKRLVKEHMSWID